MVVFCARMQKQHTHTRTQSYTLSMTTVLICFVQFHGDFNQQNDRDERKNSIILPTNVAYVYARELYHFMYKINCYTMMTHDDDDVVDDAH